MSKEYQGRKRHAIKPEKVRSPIYIEDEKTASTTDSVPAPPQTEAPIPLIYTQIFPHIPHTELAGYMIDAVPGVDDWGRVVWMSKAGELGDLNRISRAADVVHLIGVIERDYDAKLITRKGLESRTLALYYMMAHTWGQYKKKRYARSDIITKITHPILTWEHAKASLDAINAVRMAHNLKKLTYKGFKELARDLKGQIREGEGL